MGRIVRFTSQKAILKYLNEEFMIMDMNTHMDTQMSRCERKIMDKLVDKGKVSASHHNTGLWSSRGRSWTEYRLTKPKVEESKDLYTLEDYDK